jgi:AraC-like DNA-binding protein
MTEAPKSFAATPVEGDVLSDILRVVRLSGDIFLKSEFREPWSVVTPSKRELTAALEPTAQTFVLFHMVAEGACEVELDGGEVVPLRAGEVIVFPECDVHLVRGGAGVPTPVTKLLPHRSLDGLFRIDHGGTGARTRMVCGYLACEDPFVALTTILPRALCLRRNGDGVAMAAFGSTARSTPLPPDAARWLASTLQYALVEAIDAPPGGRTLLARLTEILLVEILRQYLRHVDTPRAGLLAAVDDAHVGRALRMIHGAPAHAWDVTSLARAAGVGRSVLADRFAELVGEAPMHYLARWRMQLARTLLRHETHSIAEIAALVGYQSEAAFSRAFRRIVGDSPAAWRRTCAPRRRAPSTGN